MSARDHAYHHDHQDEHTRLKKRQRELERERRRVATLVQAPHEYRDMDGRLVPNQDVVIEGVAW
jgi:hypothetical protein